MTDRNDYCGCCGVELVGGDMWCVHCRSHVLVYGAPWDRTYFAQYGKECPHALAVMRKERQ